MKRTYFIGVVLFLLLECPLMIKASVNNKPFVIPELKEWKGAEGSVSLSNQTRIVYPKGNESLKGIAESLSADLKTMFGIDVTVSTANAQKGDVSLNLKKDKSLGDEGYAIRIANVIEITAPQPVGVYWATRTLLQIAEQNDDHDLPKGQIKDQPDYAVRGFMMDCGRKFIPMEYMKDLTKMMAYYKMNTLQVHLNDNGFKYYYQDNWDKTYAAFRLESDTYPGLAARDGSYSKKEFVEFQQLAESMFVEVIPEIDAPAHVLAFTQYMPELGSDKYGADHFDLFNPAVYTFMDNLWKEYLEGDEPVFRGKKVHIGTDEYSNKDQNVVEQFRLFTDRYIKYVESFGKQAVVWGALTHAKGETPVKSENVIMGAWYNGYAQPVDMVKQGYKLISIPDGLVYIVPQTGYYYDYLDIKDLYNTWTPAHVGEEVFPEKDPNILGGMFAVWNDHCGNGITVKDVHHRLFPALQTLSTKCWTATATQMTFDDFNDLRYNISEAPGVNQMAILSKTPGIAFQQATIKANETLPVMEIGYNYRVSFDIVASVEEKGTVLFSSPNATFYLSDPIRGMLGYSREDYLDSFTYPITPGKKMHIAIEGDNKSVSLYIDGKKVEEQDAITVYYTADGKKLKRQVHTLVFPLQQAGNFKSQVSNLKVEQLNTRY